MPEQTAVKVSQTPVVSVGQPVKKHRGRVAGQPRPPSRPMDIIYSDKMNATFRSATLLVRRLKTLSRDRYMKESSIAREKFNAFLETLRAKVDEIKPAGEAEEESLTDWTG